MATKKVDKKKGQFDALSLVGTPIIAIDRDRKVLFMNGFALDLLGKGLDEVVGKKCYELFDTDHCNTDECGCMQAVEQETSIIAETRSRGLGDMDIKYYATPFKDENGEIVGCVETLIDVTEIKNLQEKSVLMAKEILEVSTPIVTVFDGVLTLPIIGTLDSQRTQQIMEALLEAIVETQARVVIVDITGVSIMDTLTATHLIKATNAVRLLGATAIITGMSPRIAQTLVNLGVDLSELSTKSRMVDGVMAAFEMLNKKVIDVE